MDEPRRLREMSGLSPSRSPEVSPMNMAFPVIDPVTPLNATPVVLGCGQYPASPSRTRSLRRYHHPARRNGNGLRCFRRRPAHETGRWLIKPVKSPRPHSYANTERRCSAKPLPRLHGLPCSRRPRQFCRKAPRYSEESQNFQQFSTPIPLGPGRNVYRCNRCSHNADEAPSSIDLD